MNILFTWKNRQKLFYVDCVLSKKTSNRYDTRITVQQENEYGLSLFAFEIKNILGQHEYKFFQGSPDNQLLNDITEVILEQFDIIRVCHLN
jgi:hypothetical protein